MSPRAAQAPRVHAIGPRKVLSGLRCCGLVQESETSESSIRGRAAILQSRGRWKGGGGKGFEMPVDEIARVVTAEEIESGLRQSSSHGRVGEK